MTKRITLALAMIGLSATAFAGSPGDNMVAPTGINLVAPDSVGTWSFGLEALYMEPGTDFQYAQEQDLDSASNNDFHNKTVGNHYNWGGEADIDYMFAGSSRDVMLSYTYMHFNNSDDITDSDDVDPIAGVGGSARDRATAGSDQTLNQVDLTFGQLVRIGDRLDVHGFGGLRFADIDVKNSANYYDQNATTTDWVKTGKYYNHSDYTGVGPRAGVDASVHLGSGFSIVGTAAGSVLAGNLDSDFRYNHNVSTSSVSGVAQTATDIHNDSHTAIVPELDAKLGVDYMYAFNPNTSMDIQLGWQFVDFINSESTDADDAVTTINSVNNMQDFSYQGPYLRLQLNVA
jgi:hypothetical protein